MKRKYGKDLPVYFWDRHEHGGIVKVVRGRIKEMNKVFVLDDATIQGEIKKRVQKDLMNINPNIDVDHQYLSLVPTISKKIEPPSKVISSRFSHVTLSSPNPDYNNLKKEIITFKNKLRETKGYPEGKKSLRVALNETQKKLATFYAFSEGVEKELEKLLEKK